TSVHPFPDSLRHTINGPSGERTDSRSTRRLGDEEHSMAQRPTMHDVAAKAGVSQAVVSLVLSGRYAGRASEATAQRIREASTAPGYRTNLQAKTLKTGISEIIGLVGDDVATSPFSGQMIKGAQDRVWEQGNTLM